MYSIASDSTEAVSVWQMYTNTYIKTKSQRKIHKRARIFHDQYFKIKIDE